LLNGLGWALCQNWHWASEFWPDFKFNWWRCWESCGGISIGLAYGAAFFLVNRPAAPGATALPVGRTPAECPNLERIGAYCGLLLGLGLSVRNGLKGWANIYLGNEHYWDRLLWKIVGPVLLAGLAGVIAWVAARPLPKDFPEDVFPGAYRMAWLVLITQNLLAQLITGPWTNWNEVVFSIYYGLLFLLTAVILFHYHVIKSRFAFTQAGRNTANPSPKTLAGAA
jgi:hypothetical protein